MFAERSERKQQHCSTVINHPAADELYLKMLNYYLHSFMLNTAGTEIHVNMFHTQIKQDLISLLHCKFLIEDGELEITWLTL